MKAWGTEIEPGEWDRIKLERKQFEALKAGEGWDMCVEIAVYLGSRRGLLMAAGAFRIVTMEWTSSSRGRACRTRSALVLAT
jgi:hypothetical protein